MSGVRKIIAFVFTIAIAVLALPAFAGGQTTTKYFSVQFPMFISLTPGAPATAQFQVIFNNATPPPGVSTINSISITTPNAKVAITAVSPGTLTSLGVDPITGGNIYEVNNFPGIKTGQTGTFTVSITDANTEPCVNGTWKATANAGNSLNGDSFNDNGQDNYVSKCDGALGCGQPFGTFSMTPGTVFGIRGLFNKDGKSNSQATCGTNVAYANTLLDASGNIPQINHYQWDTGSQPNAAFTYTVNWKVISIDITNGGVWPSNHPKVSWAAQPTYPNS